MKTKRINHREIKVFGIALLLTLIGAGAALAFGVGNVDGIWGTIDTNGATCDGWATMYDNGTVRYRSSTDPNIQSSNGWITDENQVRYGGLDDEYECPGGGNANDEFLEQSGFGFDGINGVASVAEDAPFYLGSFKHYNNPVYVDNSFQYVNLTVTVPIDCGTDGVADTTFTTTPRFSLDETPNGASPCKYGDAQPCNDKVTVDQLISTSFTCPGEIDPYTVNILGFTGNPNCTTVFDGSSVEFEYITEEEEINTACLWAEIDRPAADAAVTKSCNAIDTASPFFRVTVTNAGPGTARGVQIVDTLPDGFTYASYASLRTVGGVGTSQGTCTVAGQTVTCNLNATLPETTGDPTAKWVVDISVTHANGSNMSNTVSLTTTSADNNAANNTAAAVCYPSAAEDITFSAQGTLDAVEVSWTAASEQNIVGYMLSRSDSLEGLRTELTSRLATGRMASASYMFPDESAVPGQEYFYWLVVQGKSVKMLGPVSSARLLPEAPEPEPQPAATKFLYMPAVLRR